MAKGDDVKLKKRNKALRKKLRKDPSAVSARVAAIIATKKRRQSGKRRKCQGMCFSLPTPEDPFNERHGKDANDCKVQKKACKPKKNARTDRGSGKESTENKQSKRLEAGDLKNQRKDVLHLQIGATLEKIGAQLQAKGRATHDVYRQPIEISGGPSKFLILCLKSIQEALLANDETKMENDQSLFVNSWGVEFWKLYTRGKNVLETSGRSPSLQQMAWIVSTAADSISRKEKEGESLPCPFLLFLVPSQEYATKVRLVCKPLKSLGVHTVSLHPGASIDHQIQGLKSCEPEFLVATPERLWELILLKAIDISGVSLLSLPLDNIKPMFCLMGCCSKCNMFSWDLHIYYNMLSYALGHTNRGISALTGRHIICFFILVIDGLDVLPGSGCLDVIKQISQSISRIIQMVVFCSNSTAQGLQGIIRGSICKLSSGDSVESFPASTLKSTN